MEKESKMILKGTIFTLFIKFKWVTLLGSILCLAMIYSYLPGLGMSVSYKDMLSPRLKQFIDYEKIQSEYTRDDNIVIILESKEGEVFTKKTLEAVYYLTEELWKTPFSVRVDSITNFQHTVANGDDLIVAPLVDDPTTLDQIQVKEIREIALNEPLLLNRIVSQAGDIFLINISCHLPHEKGDEKNKAAQYVHEALSEFKSENPHLNVRTAGSIVFDDEINKIVSKDTGTFILVILAIVFVFLVAILRSFSAVFSSMLLLILSVLCGLSFGGFLGVKMTPMTGSVPLVIIIISVADCVHIITSYRQYFVKGLTKSEALVQSLSLNLQPVFYTSLTTSIGFLTMNFSTSDSIRDLGNMVAFGVMSAFVLAITFLPALICILPHRRVRPIAFSQKQNIHFQKLTEFVYQYHKKIIGCMGITSLILGGCVFLNTFNDVFPKYLHKSFPVRQAVEFMDQHDLGGTYNIAYSFGTDTIGGISDPAFLQDADQFINWLRKQLEVVSVTAVTDTLKRLNKNMHEDNEAWYQLPEGKDLSAQYLLMYEMSLPYGLDLNDQINLDKSEIKIMTILRTITTRNFLALERRVSQWIRDNMPERHVFGSSIQIMFSHMTLSEIRAMIFSVFSALFLISLLLIFMFRSFKIGLISITPNIFPAAIAFGIWGIVVGEIGMGLAMVTGMSMGIIVDDTIHFLSKYLRARRQDGLNAKDAVEYAYSAVGTPIVITSLILGLGFTVMAVFSKFRMNSDLGAMTAMIIVIALIFDLIFLPALLMAVDKNTSKI